MHVHSGSPQRQTPPTNSRCCWGGPRIPTVPSGDLHITRRTRMWRVRCLRAACVPLAAPVRPYTTVRSVGGGRCALCMRYAAPVEMPTVCMPCAHALACVLVCCLAVRLVTHGTLLVSCLYARAACCMVCAPREAGAVRSQRAVHVCRRCVSAHAPLHACVLATLRFARRGACRCRAAAELCCSTVAACRCAQSALCLLSTFFGEGSTDLELSRRVIDRLCISATTRSWSS